MLHLRGKKVTGSDTSQSEITDDLEKLGIRVHIGQKAENLDNDVEAVIYTIAIPNDNRELQKARNSGLPCISYPEALGEISKKMFTIAVSGTHGKTTTTAMTFYALRAAGIDASMIVGSLINIPQSLLGKEGSTATNYVHGDSEWIVVETCEYRRSFLNYNPEIILMTNVDNDHLDYFGSFDGVKTAFQEFVNKLPAGGALISHAEYLDMFTTNDGAKKVSTNKSEYEESEIQLQVPGAHNRKNGALVTTLGQYMQLDSVKVLQGLSEFPGTWRRQEYKGDLSGMKMYDDYGHHPTEVRVTIEAFKERYTDKKLVVVFQPHLYSRTKLLFNDFVSSLSLADQILLLPIYAAREANDETVSSELLANEINIAGTVSENNKATTFKTQEDLIEYVKSMQNKENTILLNLGAGDAYKMFEKLV
jgi:UDP-N-acetylmuramate--alanine ligase